MSDIDINDAFESIVLTEEALQKSGYDEGFAEGKIRGSKEGFELGIAKGKELAEELGSHYGLLRLMSKTAKSKKSIHDIEIAIKQIEDFPRTNDHNIDILEKLEKIRNLMRKLRSVIKTESPNKNAKGSKDLTF